VEEAVDLLMSDMTTQQMAAMGRMSDEEFDRLYRQLAPHLQYDFQIWQGNDSLLMACFESVDNNTGTDPMRIIMDQLRKQIKTLEHVIITI
jgi:hypothetical protein